MDVRQQIEALRTLADALEHDRNGKFPRVAVTSLIPLLSIARHMSEGITGFDAVRVIFDSIIRGSREMGKDFPDTEDAENDLIDAANNLAERWKSHG